jgi:hypothetical protein
VEKSPKSSGFDKLNNRELSSLKYLFICASVLNVFLLPTLPNTCHQMNIYTSKVYYSVSEKGFGLAFKIYLEFAKLKFGLLPKYLSGISTEA